MRPFNMRSKVWGMIATVSPATIKSSGRSLTVLRRRLSTVPAIQTPEWAADDKTAASLVPFLFVGAWNADNEADKRALSQLEAFHMKRLKRNSSGSGGSTTLQFGLSAPIGALFQKLICYSPSLDQSLPATSKAISRWRREYWARTILLWTSPTKTAGQPLFMANHVNFPPLSRNGISETLVLLAVHGNNLFKAGLGFDPESEAARVVKELLTPLTTRKLEANDRDLPTYAEAAPDMFLAILKQDLETKQPAVLRLLRAVDTGVFGAHPARTGLLWALEGLSLEP